MNVDFLTRAREKVPNVPLLVNIISRRVRQLNAGQRPMLKPDHPNQPPVDIALKEVAMGLLTGEPVQVEDRRKTIEDNDITL